MILYLLNLLDLVITLYALERGAVELNPLMAAVIGVHPLLFVGVKAVLALPLCWYMEHKASRLSYVIVCVAYGVVVCSNCMICILMMR